MVPVIPPGLEWEDWKNFLWELGAIILFSQPWLIVCPLSKGELAQIGSHQMVKDCREMHIPAPPALPALKKRKFTALVESHDELWSLFQKKEKNKPQNLCFISPLSSLDLSYPLWGLSTEQTILSPGLKMPPAHYQIHQPLRLITTTPLNESFILSLVDLRVLISISGFSVVHI